MSPSVNCPREVNAHCSSSFWDCIPNILQPSISHVLNSPDSMSLSASSPMSLLYPLVALMCALFDIVLRNHPHNCEGLMSAVSQLRHWIPDVEWLQLSQNQNNRSLMSFLPSLFNGFNLSVPPWLVTRAHFTVQISSSHKISRHPHWIHTSPDRQPLFPPLNL